MRMFIDAATEEIPFFRNKLERPSVCLFNGALFKWRMPKWFSFVLRALISLKL